MKNSIYQHFSNTLTIKQLCNDLALPIVVKDGYQDCPFCGRPGKLRVQGPTYKCFHPECGKKGNVVNWLIDLNFASSIRDSLGMLSSISGYKGNAKWQERKEILSTAFDFYKKANLTRAREVLEKRGISKALNEISFGYAPESNYLQGCGFSKSDLKAAYLISNRGEEREFFQDRIIFPIYDGDGNLVHLQGRACNPAARVRWLSTSFPDIVSPINHYLFNSRVLSYPQNGLFLCEGISDSLSLIEIGLPVIGCFGVQVDLCRHAHLFSNVQVLIVAIDNDRYELGSEKEGDYKSWNCMIETLIELMIAVPTLEIFCLLIPETKGKDVNDWVSSGADKNSILQHLDRSGIKLMDFCLTLSEQTSFPLTSLIKLMKARPDIEAIDRLNQLIAKDNSPAEFILQNL